MCGYLTEPMRESLALVIGDVAVPGCRLDHTGLAEPGMPEVESRFRTRTGSGSGSGSVGDCRR